MRQVASAALLFALLGAAGPLADPDWPCQQLLVPTLTADTIWPDHTPTADWHADATVAALVAEVAPRSVPVEDGVARLVEFTRHAPSAELRAEAFAGLVSETNAERGHVIERLRGIGQRQRTLAANVKHATTELRALSPDAPSEQKQEIVARRALLIREYEAVNSTIRYACEVPADLESRLGRFAQVLSAGLPE